MPIEYLETAFLFVASGFTQFINVIAGLGGGMLLYAAMASVLNYAVLVPIHGTVQLGGAIGRFYLFRQYVQYDVLFIFSLTYIPSAILGTIVWLSLVGLEDFQPAIKMVIAVCVIIFVAFGRYVKVQKRGTVRLMLAGGAVCGFVAMVFGPVGPIMAPFFLALQYDKHRFIGTWSGAALLTGLLKIPMFYLIWDRLSFNYVILVLVLAIGSLGGAFLGKMVLGKINEHFFRRLLYFFLTVIAVKLFFWDGVRPLVLNSV